MQSSSSSMEDAVIYSVSEKRKRRRPEKPQNEISMPSFRLDDLNQDVLEQVLAWLPTSNFFRLTSVCKRWKSAAGSATFRLACSQIPSREAWYFMVDPRDPQFKNPPVVFDSGENNWKRLNFFSPVFRRRESCNLVPVAASGGLICFMSSHFSFIVSNPLTGCCKELVPLNSASEQSINLQLQAIAMVSDRDSYSIVLVHGSLSELSFSVYNSSNHQWQEGEILHRKLDSAHPCSETGAAAAAMEAEDDDDDQAVYFLSKCGNVVSTNLQRSPCKQFSSVLIQKDGQKIMYFFCTSGRIVACNLAEKCYFEYPRLLPPYYEYSIDLVECGGEVYAVLLVELLESASLRIWRFDEEARSWDQIGAMPPATSHEFYGKKVDINCSGAADRQILVCVNSAEICRYFLCDLVGNEWIEVPKCCVDGEVNEFSCAFAFEPRIEASV